MPRQLQEGLSSAAESQARLSSFLGQIHEWLRVLADRCVAQNVELPVEYALALPPHASEAFFKHAFSSPFSPGRCVNALHLLSSVSSVTVAAANGAPQERVSAAAHPEKRRKEKEPMMPDARSAQGLALLAPSAPWCPTHQSAQVVAVAAGASQVMASPASISSTAKPFANKNSLPPPAVPTSSSIKAVHPEVHGIPTR